MTSLPLLSRWGLAQVQHPPELHAPVDEMSDVLCRLCLCDIDLNVNACPAMYK